MKRSLEGVTGRWTAWWAYVTLAASGRTGDGAPVEVQVRQDDGALQAVERVLKHCRAQLPAYMVPSALLALSHFPLSLNWEGAAPGTPCA